jgi:hypothetical protein
MLDHDDEEKVKPIEVIDEDFEFFKEFQFDRDTRR